MLGEALRRLALGLAAALVCARPLWPAEFATEPDTGQGLPWVVGLLLALGVAIAGRWIDGRALLRWSRTDAAVLALFLLVGLSASAAAERRMAINLAWEWAGVGIAFFLLRSLPRTPGESSALCGALAATAVAVAAYGLYQVHVELPAMQARYLRDPEPFLRAVGVDPASPTRALFEYRLLFSKEPWSTFALANSLAGFLVGPAALGVALWLGALLNRGEGSPMRRLVGPLLALVPGIVLLYTLILTKSRSAYLGLAVAMVVVAWRERRRVSARSIALGLAGVAGLVGVLGVLAWQGGGLDREVLTQSTMSLRYRWEYWQGAAGVIKARPWTGRGPGNFAGPYLRYMLPQSSEQIADPHQMILEVWATAGAFAALALIAALGFGLRDLLGPPADRRARDGADPDFQPVQAKGPAAEPAPAPRSSAWLVGCAGASWLIVVALGKIDPFTQPDQLIRWLILGCSWIAAVLLGAPLWRRGPVPAAAAGVGVLAVAINLLAAGGIGMASVAVCLWGLLALGMNLRTDRPCGRWRSAGGRGAAFALAAVWSALVGIFIAAIGPFWQAEAHLARALELVATSNSEISDAEAAFMRAAQADRYSVHPWLALADFQLRLWRAQGMQKTDEAWKRIKYLLNQAAAPPRDPLSPAVARQRARIVAELLRAPELPGPLAEALRIERVGALARVVSLDPTAAALRAELADALAEIGRHDEANAQAREALRLDRITPHADRKLSAAARARMAAGFPPPASKDAKPDAGKPGAKK